MDVEEPMSRAERRRRTEVRILAAARASFAAHGYERTTIRAIAKRADVDPGLVMQYFKSKEDLFRRAVRVEEASPHDDGPEQLADLLLASLGLKMAGMPSTSLAMLRSMFTHPEAGEQMRSAYDQQLKQIAARIDSPDAELRAALIIATQLGVSVGRHLLDLGPLRDASGAEITGLLRPYFQGLVQSSQESEAP